MWRSLIDKFNRKDRKRGYTMTELLAVIGIIAVVVAIAIPSIYVISRTLKFKQRNDYAKTIFMAAQANLSEMRSDGSLFKLHTNCDSEEVPEGHCGFPAEEWSYEYVFTSSEFPEPGAYTRSSFDTVLPVNSVESAVRDHNIIIEYNPLTGNVYAVFYCNDEILSLYREGTLPRDEESRKELMLGYYDGSGLSSSELDLESSEAYMVFDNDGEEGVLTVKVPVSESYYAHLNEFMRGLTIELTMNGEFYGGTVGPIQVDVSAGRVDVDGKTVMFDYTLDSLKDLGSFANLAAAGIKADGTEVSNSDQHLSDYLDESEFAILPGDNIMVKAKVDFNCEEVGIEVDVDDAFLVFNPMFNQLDTYGVDGFTLSVSNGRHLQNLNAIAPTVANRVSYVAFTDDVYWNETVDYYNNKYGYGGTYENNGAENPCRGLPYFVPIHNENLFGTATFEYPDAGNSNGLWVLIGNLMESIFGTGGSITNTFQGNIRVPMLTDALDANTPPDGDKTIAQSHAVIAGDNHRVYYLNIDSTKYQVPNVGETARNEEGVDVNLAGTYFATGTRQIVDYQFTGLFGYVNTSVNDLHVVNPIVKGSGFVDGSKEVPVWGFKWNGLLPQYTITGYTTQVVQSNPATGALIGASGYNAQIVNCSTYIDTQDANFSRAYMGHGDYDVDADQNWYGVSGKGAVGGLIGYAKSHRTTEKDLDNDLIHLAFRDCFAAVNVSGVMRGNEQKHYGYSNGVGGLIGNSQLTNFYNCYASGNVKADGLYVSTTDLDNITDTARKWLEALFGIILDLPYNGRTSIGAGGFVGTSHGTRYTKCFATGTIRGTTIAGSGSKEGGAGGFVGVMSLDENFSYGSESGDTSIAQTTILTECYAVGETFWNNTSSENFSGANARVNFNINQANAYMSTDYYRLYAAHYNEHYDEGAEGREPGYDDTYVFRDSYYLSGYHNAVQENSNNCATAETYATFKNLVAAHNSDTEWKEAKLKEIKSIVRLNLFNLDIDLLTWTYGNTYFKNHSELNNIYMNLYSRGYQEGWGPATEATTHSYSQNAAGARYPFTKLENLDYYGDWPGAPSAVGLAYYETYLDENDQETGRYFYFDRDSTSELATSADTVVHTDGYAVLTASQGTVKVKVGDKTFELKGKQTASGYAPDDIFRPGNGTYEVYLLTEEIMDAAMAESVKTGEFYVQVTITDPEGETYITYFNPAIALTQINPIADPTDQTEYEPDEIPEYQVAAKPSTIPPQLNIRSARQLAALSQNKVLWGEDFHYVQQFDIDADTYKWTDAKDKEIGTIGTDADVFKGTYQGNGGYVMQAKISGFEPTKGFFGSVANTGKISNLDITVGALTVGAENDTNIGILAGTNGGLIDNVDLTIQGDVTLTAKNAAGLLVGRNFGSSDGSDTLYPASITNCTVTAQNAAINAGNAGGLVGEVVGENRLNLSQFNNNTVKLIELTSNGGMVGGMVGSAEMVNFTKPVVELKLQAENALYAGGFAGGVYDGSVTNLDVKLTGSCSAQDTLAGLTGNSSGTSFAAVKLDLPDGSSLTADVAAGVIGVADSINIKNANIDLTNNHIKGTSGAAGFAYQILGDSFVQTVNVPLTGGSVTATAGKAAGYAVENKGAVSTSVVKLGDKKGNAVPIKGETEAVGFAGTVSGSISNCSVSGFGSITATAEDGRAAGFAGDVTGSIGLSYVTPAYNDDKTYYHGNSNVNLPVKAATVAGFALSVGKDGEVFGCYTLCELKGSAYGFAVSNEGTISESTSNVTQTGGVSFVGDHTGLITNCYGWYGDGEVENYASAFGSKRGKVTSSYFVNIDNREGKAELYDNSGKYDEVSPSQITPDVLNTDNYQVWKLDAKSYGTFAYDADLRPGFYPYPRLRDHHGDWVREIQYAYGVVYYEKYTDGSMAYTIKDLSNPAETVEGELYGKLDDYSEPLKGNDMVIEDTGYVLFYNAEKCPYTTGDNGVVGPEVDDDHPLYQDMPKDHPLREGNRYIVCELASDKPIEIIAQTQFSSGVEGDTSAPVEWERNIHIVPHFANAFVPADNKEFEVRTPEQLSYVGYNNEKEKIDYRGATFKQTHDIEVEELNNIGIFIGTYTTENDSELRIKSAPAGWMTTVYAGDGNYGPSSVNLHNMILEEVDEKTPIFGTVAGNVSGTITVESDIDGNLFGSVGKNGTVSDMTVTAPTASASVVGVVNGTVSGVTVEVPSIEVVDKTEGKDENEVDVFGVLANTSAKDAVVTNTTVKTNEIAITDLKVTVGGLIGSNAGTISGSTVQGIEEEAPVVITLGDNTNDDDRILTVGGLVGENTGTIRAVTRKKSQTVSSANVDIRYDQVYAEPKEGEDEPAQPKNETIAIGGLVGTNSGIVNDAAATGSISTNTEAIGKTFILGGENEFNKGFAIGGAVGFDNVRVANDAAEYENVTTAVTMDVNLATQNEVTADSPSGKGSVGTFVGYANCGSFSSCSSTDVETEEGEDPVLNEMYQFVGKARVDYVDVVGDEEVWKANSSDEELISYEDLKTTDGIYPVVGTDDVTLTQVETYTSVRPNFNDCTFQLNDETKKQFVGIKDYYYGRTEVEQSKFTVGEPAKMTFKSAGTVKFISDGIASGANQDRVDTQYYYKISDNEYGRVYWSCKFSGLTMTFTFNWYTSDNTVGSKQVKGSYEALAIQYNASFGELYTLETPNALADGKYLVVTGSNAVGDNSVTASISGVDSFRQRDNLYNFVYDGTSSRVTNVVSNTRYSVSSAVTHPADFYSSLVPTYKVGNLSVNGVTAFELHALTEEASDPKQVFTRLNDTKYNSQFIIMEDVNPPAATE